MQLTASARTRPVLADPQNHRTGAPALAEVTCRRFSKKGGHGKQLGAMNNQLKYRTMTHKRVNKETKEIKAMMAADVDFLRPLVRSVIQEFLEAEMAGPVRAQRRGP
jgi:hypothetical protein